MMKNFDILKILRIFFVVLFSIALMSCSGSKEGTDTDNSPLGEEDPKKIEESHKSECWQRSVINFSYEVIGDSTIQIYKSISANSMPLMMIAFSVWFAFRMILHVSSFTEENIGEFWKEIFSQFLLCFVCGLLASSSALMIYTLNMTVFPIFNAMLEFGSQMLMMTAETSTGKYEINIGSLQILEFDKADLMCKPSQDSKYMSGESFPTSPRDMMGCMSCAVNQRLNIGITIALQALVDWNIISLLTGLFILASFMIVKLGFVFSLVDSLFRLGIMVIMVPILILAYAFKVTRKWTQQGFLIMLSSSSFMCFISIIITITLVAMEKLFAKKSAVFGSMFEYGTENVSFKEFSATFLCLILIAFLLVQAVSIAKDISNKLVGGDADDKFAQKLKAIVQGLADLVMGLITGGTSSIAKKAFGEALKKGIEKASDKASGAWESATKD